MFVVLVPVLSTARPEGKIHSSVTNRTIGDRRAGRARRGSKAWHPWMWLKRHEAVACVWSLVCLAAHGLAVGYSRSMGELSVYLKWGATVSQLL